MRSDERGSTTIFVVFFCLALLSVAGLVIDGGYALGAKREAMSTAEQAARAGSDVLDRAALRDGRTEVEVGSAANAAESYLSAAGADGVVTINGAEVTVTVRTQRPTTILTLFGVDTIPVKATATSRSINEDEGADAN